MGVVQLVSSFESASGLPQDRVQNVLHVGYPAEPTNAQAILLAGIFRDFWIVGHPGMSDELGSWISGSILRAAGSSSISVYYTDDFSGETPFGSPIIQTNFNLPPQQAGLDFPEEVAAVLSYHADLTDVPVTAPNPTPPPATIRPQSRRRGRMFIGPLCATAGTEQAGFNRPAPAFRLDATTAFLWMCEQYTINGTPSLGVWSRADGGIYPAIGGYMDDAWDTQRRRGPDPTTRTTFTVPVGP